MRAVVHWSLFVVLSIGSFVGTASAEWPAIVARDDGTEIRGLPAISADGRTLAFVPSYESRSEAERVGVVFIDVRTGTTTGEWLVLARDDEGHALPLPADERGETPWRRARNLTLHFAARGFRALTTLDTPPDSMAPGVLLEGAGLRLTQADAADEVVVDDASGRERLRVRLPLMTSFCGMSDDAPTEAPPVVLSAEVDLRSRTLLLTYGHVYASCMCDDDVALDVFRLAP